MRNKKTRSLNGRRAIQAPVARAMGRLSTEARGMISGAVALIRRILHELSANLSKAALS